MAATQDQIKRIQAFIQALLANLSGLPVQKIRPDRMLGQPPPVSALGVSRHRFMLSRSALNVELANPFYNAAPVTGAEYAALYDAGGRVQDLEELVVRHIGLGSHGHPGRADQWRRRDSQSGRFSPSSQKGGEAPTKKVTSPAKKAAPSVSLGRSSQMGQFRETSSSNFAFMRRVTLEDLDVDAQAPVNPIQANAEGIHYQVWYGTNRQPKKADDHARGYTGKRSPHVSRGICKVMVPKHHKFGSIGSPFWQRVLRWQDDRLKLTQVSAMSELDFWLGVRRTMAEYPEDERQALIFIHGYNVSFEAAAIRAAQIGVDLKIPPGQMAFFSWPSKGGAHQYLKDEVEIEVSEPAIADFLTKFATESGAVRLHVIAHSMGNRGFVRALQRIQADVELRQKVKFGQIILAAPDIDAGTFATLAHLYPSCSERTTLYISGGDVPLKVSKWLRGYPRAGFPPPVIADKVDTVLIPQFDLLSLGHSYFAEAAGVLNDIFHLLMHNTAPERRQRLSSVQNASGKPYWSMLDE